MCCANLCDAFAEQQKRFSGMMSVRRRAVLAVDFSLGGAGALWEQLGEAGDSGVGRLEIGKQ